MCVSYALTILFDNSEIVYHAMMCCNMLYYVILCCVISCDDMFCYVILYHIRTFHVSMCVYTHICIYVYKCAYIYMHTPSVIMPLNILFRKLNILFRNGEMGYYSYLLCACMRI